MSSSSRPTLEAAGLAAATAESVHPLVQSGAETRARLVAAAERLFRERGYAGTSLRAITQAAGTSVSAANYHFGSKAGLLRSMLEERVRPLNQARLALLDGRARATLEQVIEAFLRPLFTSHAERLERGEDASDGQRLAAHLYGDRPELLEDIKRELFAEVNERFVEALREAMPGASRADAELALDLTNGCVLHVLALGARGGPSGEAAEAVDLEPLLERMVAFCVGGIRAALPGSRVRPGSEEVR